VWTEASPTSTARLLQLRPSLRGLFEAVRLEPQSQEETEALAQTWVGRLQDGSNLRVDPDCVAVALNSARQYLGAANFPGSVLDLVKLTVNRCLKGESKVIQSQETMTALNEILSSAQDAETGQRGFLLTGDAESAVTRARAKGERDDALARLLPLGEELSADITGTTNRLRADFRPADLLLDSLFEGRISDPRS